MGTNEIPRGFCQCGCGERTSVPVKSSTRDRRVAGQPVDYVHGHHKRTAVPVEAEIEAPDRTSAEERELRQTLAVLDMAVLRAWRLGYDPSGKVEAYVAAATRDGVERGCGLMSFEQPKRMHHRRGVASGRRA